jgi:2-polyprenyl-3-methyl-5-hydroxy-6-metoxy-1,4-benzoquinol methylase
MTIKTHGMTSKSETSNLNAIASKSLYAAGVNTDTINYNFSVFERYLRGSNILEMGPAEGVMTDKLVQTGLSLTCVEGAEIFCKSLAKRHPSIDVVNALFEEYVPKKAFDNVVLGHVLEHVEDPVSILRKVKTFLAPRGRVLAAVPNARSLHRQAAVIMGLLPSEGSLNQLDLHHGHRRVYDPEMFRSQFVEAGFKIEVFGGYWLKPVSNAQIEKSWTPEMLLAFMQLGERYPDIAGEIYVVAAHRE